MIVDPVVLFCLPFAGGSSLSYEPWRAPLSAAGINMHAVDYPGRGARFNRPFLQTVDDLVAVLKGEVIHASSSGSYCLFGHSFGALLAYELAVSLAADGYRSPRAVFFSGANPPHRLKHKDRRLLGDDDLLDAVARYGGINERICRDPVARAALLQILRADYGCLETHDWAFRGALDTPLVVFASDDDTAVDHRDMPEWWQYSLVGTDTCSLGPVGHLYLGSMQGAIVDKIIETVHPPDRKRATDG